MGRIRATGTLNLIQQPTEVDFDPVRGFIMHLRYRGIGTTAATLGFNTFLNQRIACKAKLSPVISELEATISGGQYGFGDTPQTNWEVLGNENEKSISESGIALAGEAAFPGTLLLLRQIQNAVDSGEIDTTDPDLQGQVEESLGVTIPDAQWAYLQTLMGFIARGQTHFKQGQYVAKLTTSVSNFYPGTFFIGSAETLWTTAQILALGQPEAIANVIESVPEGTTHPNYLWSWRQLPPRAVTGAYNRVEVSVEWWHEEWSTQLYTPH